MSRPRRGALVLAGCALLVALLTAADGELALPIGLVSTAVLAGVGYGITKSKADAAHRRLDEHAAKSDKLEVKIDQKLGGIEVTLTELRIFIAAHLPAKDHLQ